MRDATPRCPLCLGTGWADPWQLHDGAPALTWCDGCLGAGLEDCDRCDGTGTVPLPAPCTCASQGIDDRPRRATTTRAA